MPLVQYFGYVGSSLLALLLAASWLMPAPTADPVRVAVGRSTIKISSLEKLPERVVIDTGLRMPEPRK